MTFLVKSVHLKFNHIEHLDEVEDIVLSEDYSKLFNYKEFHLEKLSPVLRWCEDTEIVKYVLTNGVDLDYKTESNDKPLHLVCLNKNGAEMLKLLIDLKVNFDCSNSYNYRPIHSICSFEDGLEMLKVLIANKVNLECEQDDGYRPIHIACKNRNGYEMVKLLIENKVNINTNIKTNDNKNWIDYIIQENRIKLLEENIISPRTCGYIIRYLQEEQTVEMCQDAIDHDPDNPQYIREDLLRYFN